MNGNAEVLHVILHQSKVIMAQRQIENTIPVLAVRDLERSIAFYRSTLGFEVEWNAGAICSVARDGCSIMLQLQEEVTRATVWMGLEDDSIFARVAEAGAKVLQPPTRQPWAHEMKIEDPDGNIIWLGADPKEH